MFDWVLNASLTINQYEIDPSVWCNDAQLEMVAFCSGKLKDQNQNWILALIIDCQFSKILEFSSTIF